MKLDAADFLSEGYLSTIAVIQNNPNELSYNNNMKFVP